MSRRFFFHLIYGYSKHQSNLHKDDVNNFSMLDWDILSMSAISHVVQCLLFSINVLIWLLPTSIGLPDCGTSSREKLHKLQTSVWNFTNQFWQIQSITAPFPYTTQIFFCIPVAQWNSIIWRHMDGPRDGHRVK